MTVPADPLSTHEAAISATYRCVARYGMTKTTVEDIVKESGISRASIYRHFPGGRDELLRETVAWEIGHFFVRLGDQVRDAPDLVALLASGLRFAHQSIHDHALLQKILQTEPERLLRFLSTESARTVPFIADFLRPYIEREGAAGRLVPTVDPAKAAEYVARLLVGFIGSPGRWDYSDDAQLDDVVRHELLGGIVAPTHS